MPPRRPREHGTRRGWYQHKGYHEKPCQPCADAYAEFMREYRLVGPKKRTRINDGRKQARTSAAQTQRFTRPATPKLRSDNSYSPAFGTNRARQTGSDAA